jgi:16S rRNA (adenine1518-N6/adenine1519-N6)-dimethyltransferase
LVDPNTASLIASLAMVGPGDRVVEVGAGLGSLTVVLAGAGAEVMAMEFDRSVVPALREIVGGLPGVRVLEQDAMTADWAGLLGVDRWKMVSNLPYNIGVPLVLRMLEARLPIDTYLVMVQREVGERLAAGPGDEAYGAASVRTAYMANARVLRRVSASVFWPKPKVESVLVRLVPLDRPPVEADRATLMRLIDEGFAQRRKTMKNALRRTGLSVDEASRALSECALADDVRAESLSLADFASLAERVAERGTSS